MEGRVLPERSERFSSTRDLPLSLCYPLTPGPARVFCHGVPAGFVSPPLPRTSGKVGALAHTGSLHRKELSMPAPLPHQPSPDYPHTFSIGLHDVLTGPPTPASRGRVC